MVRPWFVILVPLALAGCWTNAIRGSGHVVTQPRSVGGFTAVSMSGSGMLLIDRNGTESLTITADDNLLPHLTAEVVDGELRLGTRRGQNVRPSRRIVYRVTVAALTGVSVSGSGEVVARGVDSDKLEIEGSGSSDFTVTGRADQQEIELSGSGSYDGRDLASRRTSIDISGSGSAIVAASEELEVEVSGSGSVDYIGDPEVSENISGSGSVRRR